MKKIAVFTSGGDAPGMNACVRAVVRTALYHNIEVVGIRRGYRGMIDGDFVPMTSYSVSNIIGQGGTILKSARCDEFRDIKWRKVAYDNCVKEGIEGLVAIGGNGTFTGAELLMENFGIPTIGCPGTIDNDLYGTDYTIGFDTAVNTALDAIDKIRDTAASHDRVFFVEVMGRDAGFIAMQCGIGGGAEKILVPENPDSIDDVIGTLKSGGEKEKPSHIVVVAEGEEIGNAHFIAQKAKEALPNLDIRVSNLGHIQRGGSPSAIDRIIASRMGIAAVEGLLKGKNNVMSGIIDDKVVYTSFNDAINKKKALDVDLIKMVKILNS
ncbi:6-phosphofructokinase [Flammeovirga kamogawensis]|uniref:ATP-dependent 6-phosphofructokinase n=1 Tax=Flammeovirga kamogawensis TaxID=373891 RepID=A0ABX8GRN5_9BACT|nr:6-phosphofructokinase [Flammeovirga kamogawensis]MBB6464014.1 6-phosphofructokinase 1 [Flammeovirga kamogawensis]QWG06108.1 6-phosphofructokinase [Flammeovirga kamogawensis]TRX67940.1 6-phosphofructokinase [Flammeovirga kamogawensis]